VLELFQDGSVEGVPPSTLRLPFCRSLYLNNPMDSGGTQVEGEVLPLADFGTMTLTSYTATVNGHTGSISEHRVAI
jgi:hypothetical protein